MKLKLQKFDPDLSVKLATLVLLFFIAGLERVYSNSFLRLFFSPPINTSFEDSKVEKP
jgi:hypothetical protein